MTSFIFPGQGSQYVGMAKDFYDNFNVAKNTFEEISEYTKINLKDLIFEDKNKQINQTNFTQIAIFTASVSIFNTYKSETDLEISLINSMFGHSLGEFSALACSNKLSLEECSVILKKRGELMNNAIMPNETGMAALIGLNALDVQNIINKNDLKIDLANDNSPIQVVVSGQIQELEKSMNIFLKNNVKKFIKLNVSAAFHSRYMDKAEDSLNIEIDKLNFIKNKINIISNYNAEVSSDDNIIKDSLKNQMSNRVRWVESIKKLEEIGEKEIIEIGPGKVLSGLINRISKSFDIRTINLISDLKKYE